MINIKPKLLRGLNVRVNLSDIANHTIYDEFFIDIIYDLSKLTFEPDLIIDCGAYHGYFSMLALAHFPATPSIAYEPSEANQNLLRANASMNHLEISIRQQAVSVEKGHRSFQEHGCGGQLSLDGAGARVEVVNLPFEIAQLNPQRLLLKLDVEGEENVIFPKLLPILPPTCAIFFEWHHGEELFLEAVQMFNDHGFGVKRQRTWFPRSDGVAFVDAVATRSQL